MVGLAFRTRNHPLPTLLDVETQLLVAGEERASTYYRTKTLAPGDDGYGYFYNIFVVTCDFAEYVDSEATIVLTLRDFLGGQLLQVSRSVALAPPPGFLDE